MQRQAQPERVHRTLQPQLSLGSAQHRLFSAVSEIQTAADDWLIDYDEYRPHDSLGSAPAVVFKPRVFN
ncbi:integrase core domain-containing protein [Roseateles flavus]|uniref:integrase core domain-containing protein n=1 Tax=Roseateles flavus TaxID=3149041 RepID=UPI003D353D62